MPEELSPESKLFVKEEIEKIRKDIREEVEEVKSKTTKIFTTIAIVVGLITGLGVYGIAKSYINTAVEAKLDEDTVAKIKNYGVEAKNSYNKIAEYEQEANAILSSQSYKMIIGTIVPYGGKIESTSGDPCQVQPGWFFCNGASLDREKYEDLFKVIGVAFGAPNDSTFNLPDLRGRFVRGVNHGTKNDPDAQGRTASNKGGNKGDKVGSVQDDAFESHYHLLETTIYEHYQSFSGGGGNDKPLKTSQGDRRSKKWIPKTQKTGGNETRPRNVYVNWIIKAE